MTTKGPYRSMLQFLSLAQAAPVKRAAEARRKDFDEIYEAWPEADAAPSWPGTVYAFLQTARKKPRKRA